MPVITERLLRFGPPAAQAVLAVVGLLVDGGARSVVAAAAIVVVSTLVAWRPQTGVAQVVVLVVLATLVVVECHPNASNVGWFGMCVAVAWAGSTLPLAPALGLGALAVATFVAEQLFSGNQGWGGWIAGTALSLAASIVGRRQAQLLAELHEAQGGLAARAAAEERARIAHELHDVIGHALTVSLLHVTSARLALAEDPDEAAASLAEAERLAQQSLAEVRTVVGLMREADATAPLPGAAQLDELADSFRAAGTDLDWRVEGDVASLTAAEGLVVYRIVQEALTNAARHAPGCRAVAVVRRDERGTSVLVDSGGTPSAPVAEGTGLTGMRERAEAVGGRLSAGPGGPGWRVEAILP